MNDQTIISIHKNKILTLNGKSYININNINYESLIGYNGFNYSLSWRAKKEKMNNGGRWMIKEKRGELLENSSTTPRSSKSHFFFYKP